jgi:hypothetical protein
MFPVIAQIDADQRHFSGDYLRKSPKSAGKKY